jgi:hypothetical protein
VKRIRQGIFCAVMLVAATGCQGGIGGEHPGFCAEVNDTGPETSSVSGWDEAGIGQGCTVIYLTDGETSLGGNNEDYVDPQTRVWFVPGEDGGYGRVYFGYANFFPQGGMNDQGLFFDAMAVDELVDVPQGEREAVGSQLVDTIMTECATVACAIDYFETYHLLDTWGFQFLFGDAAGHSAIIEPLAIIPLEGDYQVGTNFYQSTTSAQASGCWRYPIATTMLEAAREVSVEVMRNVLDAAHIDEGSPTLYSNVYDLNNRLVYLYLFHDYENAIVIDLEEELALGPHAYEIAALFPPNARWEAWASERLEPEDSTALLWIGAALAVIFAGGVGMFVGLRRGRSGGSHGEKPL